MRQIVILISLLLIFHCSYAQQNEYIINNTLGKFEGEWRWINGADTVKLLLYKKKVITNTINNNAIDMIVGFHQYKAGNHTIESSYPFNNAPVSEYTWSLFVSNLNGGDVLEGTLKDLFRNKYISVELTLNQAHTALTWHTGSAKGITVNETLGYTLPKDMILVKQ